MRRASSIWLIAFIGIVFLGASEASQPATRTIVVDLHTARGDVTLALYPELAPQTVANFLRYLDAGHYDHGQFYRAVRLGNQRPSGDPIQVVQGGLGLPEEPMESATSPFPGIAHETTEVTGLSHVNGALSMARLAPGTATSEFFISVGANTTLDFGGTRNPDGQGYAVFGQVVAGMDVIDDIQRRPSTAPVPESMSVVRGQILNNPIAFTLSRRSEESDDTTAIRNAFSEQIAAWNRGDVEAFMQTYWKDDQVRFFSGGEVKRGWDVVLNNYRKRYPDPAAMGRLKTTKLSIEPMGDNAALATGQWNVFAGDAHYCGLFTLVFNRIDTQWVIVHDHTSSAPAPPDGETGCRVSGL
ncbi:MAG: peptidylprolyl isomerase [Lysobacterales bacterium]